MTTEQKGESHEQGYGEPGTVSALYIFRHARRWTQAELGRRAGGLTQETISRIERGLERPRTSTKARLAEALQQPEDKLFPEPSKERSE